MFLTLNIRHALAVVYLLTLAGCAPSRNQLGAGALSSVKTAKIAMADVGGLSTVHSDVATATFCPSLLTAAVSETDDGLPQVRLLAVKTDVAKRYRWIVPPFPFPPFPQWRRWCLQHEDAVHCALEWRDDKGRWFNGEMRSTHFDLNVEQYRVGWGEFPGTAYDAYGVYIRPGKLERQKDSEGRQLVITVDEKINADYRVIESELRLYAAKNKQPGDEGTGGIGKENVGLGGPAYKPAQNSNTMASYVLAKAGVHHEAPERAVGWGRKPDFPYSSNADGLKSECP